MTAPGIDRLRTLLRELAATGTDEVVNAFATRVRLEGGEPGVHVLVQPMSASEIRRVLRKLADAGTDAEITGLASRAAGVESVHALASGLTPDEACYRDSAATEYERRFRAQVGDRVRPEVTQAAVDSIRSATMKHGPTHGAGVACDFAKQAGVELK